MRPKIKHKRRRRTRMYTLKYILIEIYCDKLRCYRVKYNMQNSEHYITIEV